MQDLKQYTSFIISPEETKHLTENEILRLNSNIHNNTYIEIDEHLYGLIGQSLTFDQILDSFKTTNTLLYLKICTALELTIL
jgi:hypothetical protein